jgi:hypothetical protein
LLLRKFFLAADTLAICMTNAKVPDCSPPQKFAEKKAFSQYRPVEASSVG